MNTLAEILSNAYSDQGIQDLEVFYDSYFFNLKVKDSSSNYNILLIEKFQFDYEKETIQRIKSGITLNFGDTGTDTPYYSNGNTFIKAILNNQNKSVYLIGTRTMQNGNTIPVIYLYDLNVHEVKNIFPKQSDIDNFNSFSNFTFKNNNLPITNLINDKLYIVFQTEDGSINYLNSLIFKINNDVCELISYEIVQYSNTFNIQFTNVNESFLNYKLNDFSGILKRTNIDTGISVVDGLSLDDNITVLSLDSLVVLGLDL